MWSLEGNLRAPNMDARTCDSASLLPTTSTRLRWDGMSGSLISIPQERRGRRSPCAVIRVGAKTIFAALPQWLW
jgi:hypothetical protein